MKVTVRPEGDSIPFEEIGEGQFFVWNGELYIKGDAEEQARHVATGAFEDFGDFKLVRPVKELIAKV